MVDMTDEHRERAVYVVEGDIAVAGQTYGTNEMLVLVEDTDVTFTSANGARVILLGGAPIDGERHLWWNFVSSSRERLEQAKDDWKNNRFDRIAGDDEFIPLPEK
jgi:redox-sensitive bicupin YhaK (pirin superfamily)